MVIDPSIAGVSALDRQGQLLFTTFRPEGTPLPRLPMPPGAAHVFEHDTLFVSGLTPGGLNDVMLIGFAAPWRVQDATKYALRMSLRPQELGALLREQRWPQTWTAALVDQNMAIVARSRDEALHFGKPASESLQQLIRAGAQGINYAQTNDGIDVVTVVAPVRGTPWWVAAGLPRTALAEEVSGPFRRMVGGGVALALVGVLASVALSRYLSRELRAATTGTGTGEPLIQEFESLGARQLMLQNDLVGMVRLVNRRSTWHNPALERIFGYAPGELDGHSPRRMHVDEESFEAFGRRAYPAISAGERFRDQIEMVRKDGSKIWVDVSGVALPDKSTLWMMLDVTAAHLEHERVTGLVFRDQLTGLPNRALFEDRLERMLAAARRLQQTFSVGLIDLNGFKAVNDTVGHAAGDQLLRVVAQRLEACCRASDTVARLGGDEFVLLLSHSGAGEIQAVIARIREAVRQPVVIGKVTCDVSAAIGVAHFPVDADQSGALLELADARMYADKAADKAAVQPSSGPA